MMRPSAVSYADLLACLYSRGTAIVEYHFQVVTEPTIALPLHASTLEVEFILNHVHRRLVVLVHSHWDPIFHRSTKQKSVALSSTEAEIIAMSDASTYSHWLTVLFDELRLRRR